LIARPAPLPPLLLELLELELLELELLELELLLELDPDPLELEADEEPPPPPPPQPFSASPNKASGTKNRRSARIVSIGSRGKLDRVKRENWAPLHPFTLQCIILRKARCTSSARRANWTSGLACGQGN
jgi:hypothetical protein